MSCQEQQQLLLSTNCVVMEFLSVLQMQKGDRDLNHLIRCYIFQNVPKMCNSHSLESQQVAIENNT
ncbi:hypothetical protein CY35_19G080800 [Sphagnum magellanicum]|nr:hypothetical protein CY35_19G080800 [Sphagnum magellanicum]